MGKHTTQEVSLRLEDKRMFGKGLNGNLVFDTNVACLSDLFFNVGMAVMRALQDKASDFYVVKPEKDSGATPP